VKTYIRVKSKASTYTTNKVIAPGHSVPSDEIVKHAAGIVVYRDEAPTVPPIANFPDHRVIQSSNQALNEIYAAHRDERMLRQRQTLNAVPVTEVVCSYKNETATFYVYGLNNKVYFPAYFQQCCGCCTIL